MQKHGAKDNGKLIVSGEIHHKDEVFRSNPGLEDAFNQATGDQVYTIGDYGWYIYNGGRYSYTFKVTGTQESGYLQNILFDCDPDGNCRFYLLEYDLTEMEKQRIADMGQVDLTGKIVNFVDLSAEQINMAQMGPPCEMQFVTVDIIFEYCTCPINHPGGREPDGSRCECYASDVISYAFLDNSPCGTGTGPSDGPGPGSLGGGGAGGVDGRSSSEDYPCLALTSDSPCNGAFTKPVVLDGPEDEEDENCEALNKMGKAKPYLNILEGKTSETEEYGYYYDNDPGATQADYHDGNLWKLNIPVGGTIYGSSHTHPDPDDTKAFPMFSIEDIMWVGYAYVRHDHPKPPASKFFHTLTIKNGSQTLHFAIKIEDVAKFMGSVTAYNNLSNGDKGDLENDLKEEYSEIKKDGGGYSYYTKALYEFLSDKNIEGFAIYKAGEDLNNWSKMDYDPINNSVTETPCE